MSVNPPTPTHGTPGQPRSPWIVRLTIGILGVTGLSNALGMFAREPGGLALILFAKATVFLGAAAGLHSALPWARTAAAWILATGCISACLTLFRAANVAASSPTAALAMTVDPVLWIWLTLEFIYGRKASAYFDACDALARPASAPAATHTANAGNRDTARTALPPPVNPAERLD